MKEKNVAPFVIWGLIFLIVGAAILFPTFRDAVYQTLYCSFAQVTCVKVVP